MENKDLKNIYNSMHEQGPTAWFGQGAEERKTILEIGEPWHGLKVLEIGCGEGDLAWMMSRLRAEVFAVDYSDTAIEKAKAKYPDQGITFGRGNYQKITQEFDRIVMQGVLEHLDQPFAELQWMMDYLLTDCGDVITSSPCFLNARGIVWMALNSLGAVMSKTDLHYLNTWDFEDFCGPLNYSLEVKYCDEDWGNGVDMIKDLEKRLPLALKDGNIAFEQDKIGKLLDWLLGATDFVAGLGATAVYKIGK